MTSSTATRYGMRNPLHALLQYNMCTKQSTIAISTPEVRCRVIGEDGGLQQLARCVEAALLRAPKRHGIRRRAHFLTAAVHQVCPRWHIWQCRIHYLRMCSHMSARSLRVLDKYEGSVQR